MSKLLKNIWKWTLVLMVCSVSDIMAQDPEFTQFYNSPLNLNTALAGTTPCQRAIVNYRNQWSGLNQGLNAGYVSYMASYDAYIKKFKSGLGVSILMDQGGRNPVPTAGNLSSLATTETEDNATDMSTIKNYLYTSLHYAYRIYLPGEFTMQIGLQPSFVMPNIKTDNLVFESQIDPLNGYDPTRASDPSFQQEALQRVNPFFNFSGGIAFYNDFVFGGFSMKNITQPKGSFVGSGNTTVLLDRRITLHGGTIIPLSKRYNHETFIAPEFLFTKQGPMKQLNLGLYWEGKAGDNPVQAGLWVRHTLTNLDALVPYFGIQPAEGPMKITFSYDITVSPLGFSQSFGSPELSIIFNFCGDTRPIGVCPRFT